MELRDYISIIFRHIWVVVIVIILATLSALFFSRGKATTYTASTTFTVVKNSILKQSQVNYYLYDNYYNIQSANLYAQTVANWFSSPSFTSEVYQKSGITDASLSQKELGNTFTATYQLPTNVNVVITGVDKDTITSLINASGKVVSEKTNQLGQSQDAYYEITNFSPVVTENKPSVKMNVVIGFVSGLILGILAALATFYFKREKLG